RSVPQTPTRRTRSSTSPAAALGIARSSALRVPGVSQTTVSTARSSAVAFLLDRGQPSVGAVRLDPVVDPALQRGLALAHADAEREALHHELDLDVALRGALADRLDQCRRGRSDLHLAGGDGGD